MINNAAVGVFLMSSSKPRISGEGLTRPLPFTSQAASVHLARQHTHTHRWAKQLLSRWTGQVHTGMPARMRGISEEEELLGGGGGQKKEIHI